MKYSKKRAEPQLLKNYKTTAIGKKGGRPLRYAHFKKKRQEKNSLQEYIIREQAYLCCYCGRHVNNSIPSHIEHFYPQHKWVDLQLEYSNLFVSCGLTGSKFTPSTCGVKKGKKEIDQSLIPSRKGSEKKFAYGSDGTVIGLNEEAEKAIKILNLDDDSLKIDRKKIIENIEEMISSGDLTNSNWKTELPILCAPIDGKEPLFSQVIRQYIKSEFS